MKLKYSINILFLIFSIHGNCQQELTAMKAYDIVTQYREAADSLWNKEKPSKEELQRSLVLLSQGLQYLDSPQIKDLAQGNIYLKYRRYNILFDVVHIYNLSGEPEKAISALEDMVNIGGYNFESIISDSSLSNLRTNPRYIKTISELKNRETLWNSEALKTPYRENLPLNEKIAGLSLLWSQAKYNFVHFDHADIDWNKTYLDYLNEITNTKSTAEYYKVLVKFYVALKDGHTNVYVPNDLAKKFYSRPPFRTEWIEGRVFVTDILNDSIEKLGITKGLEILTINGKPVLKYANEEVEPYQSSSTPQDLQIRTFTYALFAGAEEEPLVLDLKNKSGKEWTKTINRSGYGAVKSIPSLEYKEINGIGYLALNSFENDEIMKQFDSLFPSISKTKGLIIDLRRNGGGSSGIGFHILSSLTDKPFKISGSRVTQYNSIAGGGAQWRVNDAKEIQPNRKQFYPNPVVVLISARTFSAAEDFVVAFDYIKRGKLIGQATGGSTGQPLLFDLPGSGTARVCAKDDFYPDGRKFVGIGILPDISIKRTVADLYINKDASLQKAMQLLR